MYYNKIIKYVKNLKGRVRIYHILWQNIYYFKNFLTIFTYRKHTKLFPLIDYIISPSFVNVRPSSDAIEKI